MAIKVQQNGDGDSYVKLGMIEKALLGVMMTLLSAGTVTALKVWRDQSSEKVRSDEWRQSTTDFNRAVVDELKEHDNLITTHDRRILVLETETGIEVKDRQKRNNQ